MKFGTFFSFLLAAIIHIMSLDAGLYLFKSLMWDSLVNHCSVVTASCASKCQSHEAGSDMDDQRERESRTFQNSTRS